ncbi:MAG TPA: hypothetical protein VGQ36_26455 [Thermoanaerobaculia bacterium]|nr:hypothetical protein [Thermoanaerobaculia bacterium]
MTVAVLAMATSVSAQFCESCGGSGVCYYNPGSGTWCLQYIDYCQEYWGCNGRSSEPQEPAIAAEWTIASVEVVTPAGRQIEVKDGAVETAEVVPLHVE